MDNDNGDLMSIIESCCKVKTASNSTKKTASSDLLSFRPSVDRVPKMTSSNDITTSRGDSEGLEELCKPFLSQSQLPQSSPLPKTETVSRVRRRNKRQKKISTQAPIDTNSNNNWSWRKCGQKSIKGSPYPRGYYRCSTSKSCPARKQVEKSFVDPTMLIISYTEEHNHPMPYHCNSLKGTTSKNIPSDHNGDDRPPSVSNCTALLTKSMSVHDKEEENAGKFPLQVDDTKTVENI